MDGPQTEQIRFDRERVGIGYVCVARIRHRGIQVIATTTYPSVYRIQEIGITIAADSGLGIRGDVGRIECSKRQGEPSPAGEWRAPRGRVADPAIRGPGEVLPTL